MQFLKQTTRNLFFTGKGGVGKTSVACAAAVKLADAGRRFLLVSTDPASNLDEVLATPLQHRPTAIPSIPNLFAMNLDPETSAAEYRERMVGPYRTLLPAAAIVSMEDNPPVHVLLKSLPSMNSRGCSAMLPQPLSSIM